MANIRDYLSQKESVAASNQESKKSKRPAVKKMTAIELDSSDRKPRKDFGGVQAEAVGGRIVTTLKKNAQDFGQTDADQEDAVFDTDLQTSQNFQTHARKSILHVKGKNQASVEQNIARMYEPRLSKTGGNSFVLDLSNPGQGITFDQNSYEEYKIKSTESRELFNFEAEKQRLEQLPTERKWSKNFRIPGQRIEERIQERQKKAARMSTDNSSLVSHKSSKSAENINPYFEGLQRN